jgi:hypothetical protein
MKTILFPQEWEFVVENDSIRWGMSSKPERQRRLSVPKVARIIHDKSDNKILADVGGIRLLPIADYVLVRSDDQAALVDYLRQSFPQLTVEIA